MNIEKDDALTTLSEATHRSLFTMAGFVMSMTNNTPEKEQREIVQDFLRCIQATLRDTGIHTEINLLSLDLTMANSVQELTNKIFAQTYPTPPPPPKEQFPKVCPECGGKVVEHVIEHVAFHDCEACAENFGFEEVKQ